VFRHNLAEGVKLLARAHQSAIWGRQRQLDALRSALHNGGRQRNVERRAEEIQQALGIEQLEAPERIANAHGLITRSELATIATFNAQIAEVETAPGNHR